MSTQKTTQQDVESWELSDELMEKIEPLLPKPKSRFRGRGRHRHHVGGRPPADRRRMMAGILYVLRTGCQWNAAPKEFGSGKTLHRYFQKWTRARVFKKLWKAGLLEYDRTQGIVPACACTHADRWTWQAVDGAMTKAPLGGGATGPNPTDLPVLRQTGRAKCGTKRSLLTDGRGGALGDRRQWGQSARLGAVGAHVGGRGDPSAKAHAGTPAASVCRSACACSHADRSGLQRPTL